LARIAHDGSQDSNPRPVDDKCHRSGDLLAVDGSPNHSATETHSVVAILQLHPANLGSNFAVIRMSYQWHLERHLAKLTPVHQISLTSEA